MDLTDAFYLVVLVVAAWVFLPRRWRYTIVAARDTWWSLARPRLWEALVILERGAYRLVVGPPRVKGSAPAAPALMSRTSGEASDDRVSSEDGQDGPDEDAPAWTRDDLLKLYTFLRQHKVKREALRPLLKPFGVPLSNDVWAEAAPPEPPAQTPIGETPYDPARYRGEAPAAK